ncbi:MAG: hypothetical protein H0X30_27875 [Anaerolineae bacterium]|nr:hypothetical protein [Anaerolineae bacterium]
MQHPLFDGPAQPMPVKVVPLPPPDELTIFDEAAVDENYDGKLAAHQVKEFRKSAFNVSVIVVIAYIITLLLSLAAWGEHLSASLIPMFILFVICSALCYPLFKRITNLRREISNQSVVHIDGRVHLLREIMRSQRFYGSSIRNHAIIINDIRFYVPEKTFEICRRDMNYRLYYTPITRQFVNIHSL